MGETTPLDGPKPEQDQLFGIGEAHYGQTIRYLDPVEVPVPYATPEKPKKLEDMTAEEMIWVAAHDGLVPDIYGHFNTKWARTTLMYGKLWRGRYSPAIRLICSNGRTTTTVRRKKPKKIERLRPLTALTDKLASLDDATLEHLLVKTLTHEQARLKFLSDQLETARTDDKTSDLIAAVRSRA